MSSPAASRVVAFANRSANRVEQKGKSLIYIKNRIGPSIDPCGTPIVELSRLLETPLTLKNC